MNASHRLVNRLLLLLTGLVLIALAGLALLHFAEPLGMEPWAAEFFTALAGAGAWVATVVTVPLVGDVPLAALLLPLAGLLLALVLIVFVLTCGGGRVAAVLHRNGPDGQTFVDRNVAQGLLADPLSGRRDVLSVRTRSYRVKGEPTLMLDVTVRRGAELGRVLEAVEDAVQEWDRLLGARVPMVIHFSDRGMLAAMRSSTRTH